MPLPSFLRSLRPGDDPEPAAEATGDVAEAPSRLALVERLRTVIDPEVGLNIVDLGLIYDLQIEGGTAEVRLTMTTPACPMSSYIERQVGAALRRVPGLQRGVVELVWDPPWSPHMVEPEARLRLFGGRRFPTY